MRKISIFLICLALAGCGLTDSWKYTLQAYDGPAEPNDQVGTIYSRLPTTPQEVRDDDGLFVEIVAVDGYTKYALIGPPLEVKALPGQHSVDVHAHRNGSGLNNAVKLTLEVVAGHTYQLRCGWVEREKSVQYWFDDKGVDYVRTDGRYVAVKKQPGY